MAKIILRQFDRSKKKKKKDLPNELEDPEDDDKEERVLDKEEKEMDDGNEENDEESDDVDIQRLEKDIEIMEGAMEEEIEGAVTEVEPVRQVLYKVGFHPFLVISSRFRSEPFIFLLFF